LDISFHYFAVKTVARAAGLNEKRAQRIAEYSQFIDDYNQFAYTFAKKIPSYVKAPELDIVYNETLKIINPVTTGFYTWDDYVLIASPRQQRLTVVPYHFIPMNEQKMKKENDWRTVPATLNNGSYIADELKDLKNDIAKGTINENDALMKSGMLLHTFADTHAHQLFTGFLTPYNSASLVSAFDNITGKDITKEAQYWIDKFLSIIKKFIPVPTIGHMILGHVPDLTHISFEMKYKGSDGKIHHHTRSNTEVFANVCKLLYDYLKDLPYATETPTPWNELEPLIAKGLLVNAVKELEENEKNAVKKLTEHWSKIFNYNYEYSSDKIRNSFVNANAPLEVMTVELDGQTVNLIGTDYSDEFFKYNLFADKHLVKLYGPKPRSWFSAENIEFYDFPVFD